MKKSIKILLVLMCVAIISVAFAACDFGYPKVAGNTYEYDKTEYDKEGLSATDITTVETQLSTFNANKALTLVFSGEDKTVGYTTSSGTQTYNYEQSGVNVVLYDAPNQNTKYNGDMVTGFTITKESNEVLTWHITLVLYNANNTQVNIYMYYNLVPAQTPAE